ncbi:MAG: prenyltransferase [Candidatus Gastranaerophilales bacterium]|nr:prenyltransferase [Candidatus Gastranaerophilales bacterium]
MEFFKNFVELTRGYTLLVTFASCFVIYSYAHYSPRFSMISFILMAIGLCCVHLGANLYDDYKDVKKQLEAGKKLDEVSFNAYIPKAMPIRNRIFSLNATRHIINMLFVIAIAIGICFIQVSGWPVAIFMTLGAICTLFYPYSSKYNCQELIVGLVFGPFMIVGGYYALTSEFNFGLILLSFAMFFATLTLLHAKNIMDWEFDIQDNKKTLAILSGSKENAIKLLTLIMSVPYIIVIYGVLTHEFNPKMLYVFLTLPIATKLISSMKEYIMVKNVEFKPRWYWGMFENWKNIKERNIEFFMFRFYLARNFSFFFGLFAAIGVML